MATKGTPKFNQNKHCRIPSVDQISSPPIPSGSPYHNSQGFSDEPMKRFDTDKSSAISVGTIQTMKTTIE